MNPTDLTKHLKTGQKPNHLRSVPINPPPGTPIQVDLKNAILQKCSCGSTTFSPAMQIYKVSALISPTGQELIANQQVVVCTKCGVTFGEEEKK